MAAGAELEISMEGIRAARLVPLDPVRLSTSMIYLWPWGLGLALPAWEALRQVAPGRPSTCFDIIKMAAA